MSTALNRPRDYHRAMRQIPPSRILVRELEAREMSVTELADLSGLSCDVIAGVLLDGLAVDAAIAQGLSQALGSSVEFWLRLQGEYEKGRPKKQRTQS